MHIDTTKSKKCTDDLVEKDGFRASTNIILNHMLSCELHSYKALLPFE